MEATATRNSRKSLIGTVTSRSGDKTIKVTYFYKIPHPLYRKEIKRKTVVHAHDEANDCGLGDRVEIMETRPISKLKRWRVTRVLERAPKLDGDLDLDSDAIIESEANHETVAETDSAIEASSDSEAKAEDEISEA
ncbi:MAG: 30S ribosomal protein S17 [Opitutia bacterium UBA7350]|nr:MAG: 30S ribosomal protein S17 [Opitutae bacterium UBA7350]